MTLSEYERREWELLTGRRESRARASSRAFLPKAAIQTMSNVVAGVKRFPVPIPDAATGPWEAVSNNLGNFVATAAAHSVSADTVVAQYAKAGHDIADLTAIRNLDLSAIDSVANIDRLGWRHSGTAALSGLTAGAAISGAEVMLAKGSIAGKGANKAPSFAVVATAMTADLAATLTLAARTVSSIAAWYGFDPREPEEQVFIMSVMRLGLATGQSAKTAAYFEVSQLSQLLFRNATWEKLSEKVLTRIVQQFATQAGFSLTKRKLGQAVPVAGIAVGMGMNATLIQRVSKAADTAYRERFLLGKSGGTLSLDPSVAPMAAEAEGGMSVIELLSDEGALPQIEASKKTRKDT